MGLVNVQLEQFDDDQFSSDVVNILLSRARSEIRQRRNYIRCEIDDFPVMNLLNEEVKGDIYVDVYVCSILNRKTLYLGIYFLVYI